MPMDKTLENRERVKFNVFYASDLHLGHEYIIPANDL